MTISSGKFLGQPCFLCVVGLQPKYPGNLGPVLQATQRAESRERQGHLPCV